MRRCTEEGKSRVAALGRLTACYTVGATLGPALGGWLGANVDHYFGAKLAVAGSLLSALLSYLFIPSQMRVESPKGGALEGSGSRPGLMVQMRSVVAPTADVLAIKVFTGMANSMLSTAMPLILKDTFAFKEDQMGLAQSAMTFLTAICNAFFLGPLVAMCGSLVAVIRLCLIGTVAGLVGQALLISYQALTAEAFILCRMGLSLFQFILAGNLTAESTSRVSAELKGSLLGTEHALFSAVRVFSPTWSVSVLNSHGILGLTICSASIYAATTATWIFSGFVYGKVPGQQQDAVGHNALPAHKAGQEATQQEKKAR